MSIQEWRRRALGVAVVAGILAGTTPWEIPDRYGASVMVIATGGLVWTILLLVAIGGVTYAAGSLAAEHVLDQRRRVERERASESGRRAGREVPRPIVVGHVRDGVATPAELADVLDVHLHVARRMLEALVAEGHLLERADGRVAAPEPPPRSVPTGPRWIDPEG